MNHFGYSQTSVKLKLRGRSKCSSSRRSESISAAKNIEKIAFVLVCLFHYCVSTINLHMTHATKLNVGFFYCSGTAKFVNALLSTNSQKKMTTTSIPLTALSMFLVYSIACVSREQFYPSELLFCQLCVS